MTVRLCEVLRQYRWATKQQGKVLAEEIGIDPSTLSRFEHGRMPDATHLAQILRWLLDDVSGEGGLDARH